MALYKDMLTVAKYAGIDNRLPARSRRNRRRQASKARRQQGKEECRAGGQE